jgi:fatty acid desaturase
VKPLAVVEPELRERVRGLSDEQFLGLVRAEGLLEPKPGYYALLGAVTLGLLALVVTGVAVLEDPRLLALDAVLLAFVYGQIAGIGHEAGHGQIVRSRRGNEAVGRLATLLTGLEGNWWRSKHDAHHATPNQEGRDPDVEIPVIALTPEQALRKGPWARPLTAIQAFLFVPAMCTLGLNWQLTGAHFVLTQKLRDPVLERVAMLGHLLLYYGGLFALLDFWAALQFIAIHQACFGLYLSLIFAPNHMGMPVLAAGAGRPDLEHQLLTARNIRGDRVVDYLMCGLNRQLEHHVAPGMSRSQLAAFRPWVIALSAERGVPYHEVGFSEACREILRALHRAGAPLRSRRAWCTPSSRDGSAY